MPALLTMLHGGAGAKPRPGIQPLDVADPNDPRNQDPGNPGFQHGPIGGPGLSNPAQGGPRMSPGPGFDPSATHLTPDPPYLHSLATRALRKAGYGSIDANHLIRLARRGKLAGFQGPSGAYHDPTKRFYDPTPPTGKTSSGSIDWSTDPNIGDTRRSQPTDPGYYGGFRSPAAQQGLEAVAARGTARRAQKVSRKAAR